MATTGRNTVTLAAVFIWNLQTCHAYCSHYGSCYGVWGMWYFWMSLIVLLVICCGAIGGYWRRRQVMQAMHRQQQEIIRIQGTGNTNVGYTQDQLPVFGATPPPYNVATQAPTWQQPGKDTKIEGAPPSYFEAVPPGYQPHQAPPPNGSYPLYTPGAPPYPVQPMAYPTPPETQTTQSTSQAWDPASSSQGPNLTASAPGPEPASPSQGTNP